MNRCSFCEWIPILPWPVWPLAGQCLLGQNVVVGSMLVLLALCGSMPRGSVFGPPFSLQVSCTTVKCRATPTKFEAEQPTKPTDCSVIFEPWQQTFPPQTIQSLLLASCKSAVSNPSVNQP